MRGPFAGSGPVGLEIAAAGREGLGVCHRTGYPASLYRATSAAVRHCASVGDGGGVVHGINHYFGTLGTLFLFYRYIAPKLRVVTE